MTQTFISNPFLRGDPGWTRFAAILTHAAQRRTEPARALAGVTAATGPPAAHGPMSGVPADFGPGPTAADRRRSAVRVQAEVDGQPKPRTRNEHAQGTGRRPSEDERPEPPADEEPGRERNDR